MRDSAALVLAKVVAPALQKILEDVGPESGFAVSMQLAGNELHRTGIAALLEATISANAHVGWLYVERNRLDSSAAEWLAAWVERQPGGPPREVYMSQNKVGQQGALRLLEALGRCSKLYRQVVPTWIEMNDNRIADVSSLLDELSSQVSVCLAMDRSLCGRQKCGSCENAGDISQIPRLHLWNILEQADPKADIASVESKGPRVKSERSGELIAKTERKIKAETSIVKVDIVNKVERLDQFPRLPLADAVDVGRQICQSPEVKCTAGRPSDVVSSPESALAAIDVLEASCGRGGRGRGRGRGRGSGPGSRVANASVGPSTNSVLPSSVSAKIAEAEERLKWTQILGKGVPKAPNYGYDDKNSAYEPPSFGLWDLARQRRLRPEKWVAAVSREGIDNDLHAFITKWLLRDARLWSGSADHERRLRCRCLSDQFSRHVNQRFGVLARAKAANWGAYLQTQAGLANIDAWLRAKVGEHLSKQRVKQLY
jgi:hypothetical protein